MDLQGVKLACLMPTFNKQSTIKKAVESVLMQKTDFKFKLIILDDASNDGSYEIAQNLQAQNPGKIELVRNEKNLKLLNTMNVGYKFLKNIEYFCVLDPDDWYIYDKKFADAVAFLDKNSDFVIYMANINLLKNGILSPWVENAPEILDFSWEDYKCGRGLFVQTSGAIYRNVYFKDGLHEAFYKATQGSYGEALRADGFRCPWHLRAGKAHFVNRFESVYNYNDEGQWASMTEFEQDLANANLHLAFCEFFPEDKQYFLKHVKFLFDRAVQALRKADFKYIAKNKDLIFDIFTKTYLSDNVLFDPQISPNPTIKSKTSFIEKIFSIKNSPDKKRKIITILGVKFKIKRKKREN